MGYWNIEVRCAKCNHEFYLHDENYDLKRCMEEEYNSGYKAAKVDEKSILEMSNKVSSMQDLLAANARVLKQEIEKEIRAEMQEATEK